MTFETSPVPPSGAPGPLLWDNHACMPLRPGDTAFLPQLQRVKAAGFHAVTLNIGFGEQSVEEHLRVLASFRRWLLERPDEYVLVGSVGDLERARASGRLGVLFDIEGACAIDDQLSLVRLYYDLGVRWMLIAYNRRNLAGSGCYDPEDEGLTDFGRAMIDEMARVGMVLCCSHTGPRTAREAIEASKGPMIFSHSNCAAVHPHARNIGDDLIRACAETGGVIGVNGIGDFLGPRGCDLVEAVVRHIDHVSQLVGPSHVGLALDYVYDQDELRAYLATMKHTFPDVMDDDIPLVAPEAFPAIRERLDRLGYAQADIDMISGGNWLRIAREVWK